MLDGQKNTAQGAAYPPVIRAAKPVSLMCSDRAIVARRYGMVKGLGCHARPYAVAPVSRARAASQASSSDRR